MQDFNTYYVYFEKQKINQHPPTIVGRFWRLLGTLGALLPVLAAGVDDVFTVPLLRELLNPTSWKACTTETATRTTSNTVSMVSFFILSISFLSVFIIISCQHPPTIWGRSPIESRFPALSFFSRSLSLSASGVSSSPLCSAAAPFSTMFLG